MRLGAALLLRRRFRKLRDNQSPRDAAAADLTEAELDRILPPVDEDDPEWQAYARSQPTPDHIQQRLAANQRCD